MATSKTIRVMHFQRLPMAGYVSIERLFDSLRVSMPNDIECAVHVSPRFSKGVWSRFVNLRAAKREAGPINHITGDVHYLAFGIPGRGSILTVHDCAALNRLRGIEREILRYFWFTGPMRRAAVVTTISETAKNELRQWVGPLADRVKIIPNCVPSGFVFTPKEFSREAPLVLQVGTAWNKNVERTIAALQGTPCRLEIVGELTPEQRRVAEGSGVVYRELGRLSDVELMAAYRRCDLVLFASLYEGFGLPIVEAQAIGRPVITSNRSSMPEVAGEGAVFVDPESVSEIRSAVLAIVQQPDLREQLVAKGMSNAKRFQPQAVAAQYAALYRELVAKNHDF